MIWDKQKRKYRATISFKNKPIFVGFFADPQEAEKARQVTRQFMERKYGKPSRRNKKTPSL